MHSSRSRCASLLAALTSLSLFFVVAAGETGLRGSRAQELTPTPPPPWEPPGSWQALHAPGAEPLWTGGEGHSLRPCGLAEESRAGNRGSVAPLCAVHGQPDGQGGWYGWAVGEQGLLARYADGSWEAVDDLDPRTTSPLTYHLHDVFVIAEDDVWAVGWVEGDNGCADCGVVLHYDGQSWQAETRQPMGIFACMEKLNAIDMAYDEEIGWYGWIVGDNTDCQSGGAVYLGYNYDMDKPDTWRWFRVPQASEHMHDVRIVERGDVWAVGNFGIESHWYKPVADPSWSVYGKSGADDRFAVDLTDATYGWNAGVRGRLNRYIGSCHDDDMGTQCWFDNMASPIQDLNENKVIRDIFDVDLIDRGRGWMVGKADGRQGTVAHFYEDKRWRLVSIEGDPGKSLFGLHVIAPDWAVAVGEEGVVLEYRADEVAPTSTATATEPVTATETATATATETAGATGTVTVTPEMTATSFVTGTATVTATVTITETATATATASRTPTIEATPSPTDCLDCWVYVPFLVNRR